MGQDSYDQRRQMFTIIVDTERYWNGITVEVFDPSGQSIATGISSSGVGSAMEDAGNQMEILFLDNNE